MNARTAQTLGVVGATDLIREDHRKIKELFQEFEGAGPERKKSLAPVIMRELEVHTAIEEDLFYPEARRAIKDDQLIVESEEAQHVVKLLLSELKTLPIGKHFIGKFQVLMNTMRHHIRNEENELLPKVERSNIDLMELGEEMSKLKMKTLRSTSLSRGMILTDETTWKTGAGLGALIVIGAIAAIAARLWSSSRSEERTYYSVR